MLPRNRGRLRGSFARRDRKSGPEAAPRKRLPRRWNDATVRAELEPLLAGDDVWPPYSEFERHVAKSVRDAVTQLGGERRWAERLGLRYTGVDD